MKKHLVETIIVIVMVLLFPISVSAENFIWPSTGYIGWRYYQDTSKQEGISGTYHTGIDIWSNTNGGWNNGVIGNSNPVYSTYSGTVVYVDNLGLIIKHSNTLYTKYWHIRNRQVALNNSVNSNTLLGYQDNASAVHVHLTISSALIGSDADNTLDPSNYFGLILDVRNPNVIPWGYYVSHSTCTNTNISISNTNIQNNVYCVNPSNSIDILPVTNILGESRFYIQ